jgi:D-aminoacyl-tRNA deacylase
MRLLLCSTADEASVNIKDRLLERARWQEVGSYDGHPVLSHASDLLVTFSAVHLHSDDLDHAVSQVTGKEFESVVFLSRHKAASGIPTLTVHPIGNYGKADYGGRAGTLVPCAPEMMTSTLRSMQRMASGLPFQVSFEVTHHGPFLTTPTMYIEIGSDEGNWGNIEAGRVLAQALLETEVRDAPVAIGIGGGHYAPRFTESVITKKVAFGHMIPNHALEAADDAAISNMIHMALQNSSGARLAYIHKKSMARSRATHIKAIVESLGAQVIDSSDLEDLVA